MSMITAAAESFVEKVMRERDASHDFSHMLRVRNVALSLAKEEGLPHDSLEIVELAALLHDVDDHKYAPKDQKRVEQFLISNNVDSVKSEKIVSIIKNMGFKEELENKLQDASLEYAVVQDADRLDAIGAIGIARCFTYGGSRNHVLYDPSILPLTKGLTKEEYAKQDRQQTMINHFHEKLLKLKSLMKTEAGGRRAEKRHKLMETYLEEFYQEWEGNA